MHLILFLLLLILEILAAFKKRLVILVSIWWSKFEDYSPLGKNEGAIHYM